jgi:hypothetical protein
MSIAAAPPGGLVAVRISEAQRQLLMARLRAALSASLAPAPVAAGPSGRRQVEDAPEAAPQASSSNGGGSAIDLCSPQRPGDAAVSSGGGRRPTAWDPGLRGCAGDSRGGWPAPDGQRPPLADATNKRRAEALLPLVSDDGEDGGLFDDSPPPLWQRLATQRRG